MPVDLRVILTSESLFADLIRQFSIQRVEKASGQDWFEVNGQRCFLVNGPAGWDAVQSKAGVKGGEQVFLGKEYAEILSWAGMGVRTAWFNPERALAPGQNPVHDLDISSLDPFIQILTLQSHPTLAQSVAWWDVWALPDNIRQHVITVGWAAYALAALMRCQGVAVNPILAHRGGLLHDLDKVKTMKNASEHGERGAEFLLAEGYPVVAEIARGHIMHRILDPDAAERPWETKLVYFCDKLVEGDRIVTLDERFAGLQERYPVYMRQMGPEKMEIRKLNDEICSILSIPNHEILISTLTKLQNN